MCWLRHWLDPPYIKQFSAFRPSVVLLETQTMINMSSWSPNENPLTTTLRRRGYCPCHQRTDPTWRKCGGFVQQDCQKMMAESMPICGAAGPLSGLEMEAWYEDLQDILFSETKNTAALQLASDEQVETLDSSPYLWTLESIDSTLPVNFTDEEVVALETVVDQFPTEVLEFLAQGSHNDLENPSTSESLNNQQDGAIDVDSGCSSCPSQTHTEDEDSSGSQCGTKRKRNIQPRGGKVRVREKEQENEKKVAHLVTENERLKGEIERLTSEVERTRKSLIERMVNMKK